MGPTTSEPPHVSETNRSEMERFKSQIDELSLQVKTYEEKAKEIEQFYLNASKRQQQIGLKTKDRDNKEKNFSNFRNEQQQRECSSKRMQDLMRQLGTIIRLLTQHKWAWPFLDPVDVKGLGLDDYYTIIDKPMDFSTIKNQMEAKDGTGYKNCREICADVRLIFKNAMKYNKEGTDVYIMAETLLEKFEEKWLQFLPKVTEEEERREKEEAEARLEMQLAEEASRAKTAKDLINELDATDAQLDEVRDMVVQNCRKMSTEEKRSLGMALTRLSPEDLTKALEIVAQNNPRFQATGEEVDLDIDDQSQTTLWRLKVFVKDALEVQGKSTASLIANNNSKSNTNLNNNKRKRDVSESNANNAKKKSMKPS